MKRIFCVLFLLTLLIGCGDDGPNGPNSSDFDRTELLENWADNLIIPAYESFSTEMDELESATSTFTTTPSESNLTTLRTAWYDAYLAWQSVSMFEIGKAEALNFRNYMNIYPVSTTEVDDAISSGTYDLTLPSMFDAQGFPAIDYLINGLASTDADIVAFYSTNGNAANYKAFLSDVVTRMDNLTDQVLTDWQTNYRDEFVANSGSSSTSSVDRLVNDFLFYYEKSLRAGKVGIPAGVFSSSSLPDKVEAFYKEDISRDLLLAALDATKDFYEGNHFGKSTSGESLNSYLAFLQTIVDGDDLHTAISNQFDAARAKIVALDQNFVTQINTENTKMLEAYDELQKNVVFMKVDMLQALDINVDYVDADGD